METATSQNQRRIAVFSIMTFDQNDGQDIGV